MTTPQEPRFDLKNREKLDYPYRLDQQIETFQKATLNLEYSRREIEESINGLVKMIPSRWRDQQFKDDLGKCKTKVKVDVRPSFAGVKMKAELCEKKGIPIIQEVETLDHFNMLLACIDQLDRLGMLTRREFIEAVTGMPFGEEALPEGMNLQEYLASLDEDPGDETEIDGL